MSEFGLFLLCTLGGRTKSRLRSHSNGSGGEQVEAGTRKVRGKRSGRLPLERGAPELSRCIGEGLGALVPDLKVVS